MKVKRNRLGYYATNAKHLRAKQHEWKLENPASFMIVQARSRAKKRGLKFDIELSDLLPLPTFCPVYGIPLVYGATRRQAGTASLDRLEPSKGYVKGNVAVISWKANNDKWASTAEQLEVRLQKSERKIVELRALVNYVSARKKRT
jgi:hypothetical protein